MKSKFDFAESQATNPELTNFRNGGGDSPVPSLALTEGDFGEEGEISTSRSTLQRSVLGLYGFGLIVTGLVFGLVNIKTSSNYLCYHCGMEALGLFFLPHG